jgi:hypothetical protein
MDRVLHEDFAQLDLLGSQPSYLPNSKRQCNSSSIRPVRIESTCPGMTETATRREPSTNDRPPRNPSCQSNKANHR